MSIFQNQLIMANLASSKKKAEAAIIQEEKTEMKTSNLREIRGIGEKTVVDLHEAGIRNTEQLREAGEEKLKGIIKSPFTLRSIMDFIKGK